jgi:hypothetical protein
MTKRQLSGYHLQLNYTDCAKSEIAHEAPLVLQLQFARPELDA